MGVDSEDCLQVAELIGYKITLNEFVAYSRVYMLFFTSIFLSLIFCLLSCCLFVIFFVLTFSLAKAFSYAIL